MTNKQRHAISRLDLRSGYSLIELVIVIALTVILLITAVSLFFTTFIGGGKTASGEYTKQAGQNTLNQMTYLIRNSRKLVPNAANQICAASMNSLGVLGLDGGTTILSTSNGQIASNSGMYLTPSDLKLSSPLTFSCSPTTYGTASWDGSPPRISINFSLQKGNVGSDLSRDIVTIPFQSVVTLRNF
jgi:type II secretory pathway pseudopilin PulG